MTLLGIILSNISLVEKIHELPLTWKMWIGAIALLASLTTLIAGFFLIGIMSFFSKKNFPKIEKFIKILFVIFFLGTIISALFLLLNIIGVLAGIIMIVWISSALMTIYYITSPFVIEPKEPIEWKKFMIWGTIAVISLTVGTLLTTHHLM